MRNINSEFRQETCAFFGIDPLDKIIVVGHQPVFFHPGILAKFIAASEVAKTCNAKLVHLVVDHHIGDVGTLEIPKLQNGLLEVDKITIAPCDDTISLCDQKPLKISEKAPKFAECLKNDEHNAAMQIAVATDKLMSSYATVHHCIAATELLKSPIGVALLENMFANPEPCITAYNNAINAFPHCSISLLEKDELPLWHGPQNKKVTDHRTDLRPRALLLTLLARVGIGDLFVHGTGGASYDPVMEHWCRHWLGVEVCSQVMATASLKLSIDMTTVDAARQTYFSGDGEMKQAFLDKIDSLPRGSTARRIAYLEMQRWLDSCHEKPDHGALLASQQIANRRDWAFPLYNHDQLQVLTKAL